MFKFCPLSFRIIKCANVCSIITMILHHLENGNFFVCYITAQVPLLKALAMF